MATEATCARCGSADVIADAVVQPDAHPGRVLVKSGGRHAELTARVCTSCGHTELVARDAAALRPAPPKRTGG